MMLNSALLSISTLTPSCSTVSSNMPAWSTYSKWYARPEQPRFLTPTRIILGLGCASRLRSWATADVVRPIAAFLGRSLEGLGAGFDGAVSGGVTGIDL